MNTTPQQIHWTENEDCISWEASALPNHRAIIAQKSLNCYDFWIMTGGSVVQKGWCMTLSGAKKAFQDYLGEQ